ncbi:hypothetical protein QYM36_013638 [Artemia franciscana]|uniref:Uncharacterized protein n=1 Tax=Artemia franciscana TaxID=6661 RepID=A0AA88HLW2_ARTSF|nr:hypothetical protein QYM36_013638 [Artemia franciscana]
MLLVLQLRPLSSLLMYGFLMWIYHSSISWQLLESLPIHHPTLGGSTLMLREKHGVVGMSGGSSGGGLLRSLLKRDPHKSFTAAGLVTSTPDRSQTGPLKVHFFLMMSFVI